MRNAASSHVSLAILDWLRSYLADRAQFVKMGQHQSDTVALDVGVPQGSVLGPLLFAVYCIGSTTATMCCTVLHIGVPDRGQGGQLPPLDLRN